MNFPKRDTPSPDASIKTDFGPSKGVDYYAYLGSSVFTVLVQSPKDWGKETNDIQLNTGAVMLSGNLQISESDIGLGEHTGRFQWTVAQNSSPLQNEYVEIAPSDGMMGESSMGTMINTPSHVTPEYAFSYGFYDSGSGITGLTNQDQSYVYVTINLSNWMYDLVSSQKNVGNAPFNSFVLAGAHDAGMSNLDMAKTLVSDVTFLAKLISIIGPIISKLSTDQILRVITNLSITQKDTITTLLNLGIRYFDFRPGYCISDPLKEGLLYHQHNFIPGYAYADFLDECLTWLVSHPSEIIVISINNQGFAESYMNASTDVLNDYLNYALKKAGITANITGDKSDLSSTYNELIASGKRLIFLNQYGFSNDARKYDSYNDKYKTASVRPILQALEAMNRSGQQGNDYTVLQLQGTANGIAGGVVSSIMTGSDASSPLMSTKAQFDHATYPFLTYIADRLSNDQLLICLNDFADNVLVTYCIMLIKQRCLANGTEYGVRNPATK